MKRIIYGLVGLSLSIDSAQAFTGCNAQAEHKWNGLTIEGVARGDACKDAVVTLIIRNKQGAPIWTRALIASQVLTFSNETATDAKGMMSKLSDWISGEGFNATVDQVREDGEFSFTRSDQVDAKTFKSYRKSKRPMFCYVQGQESGNCLVLNKDGAIEELGIQSFPG